MRTSLRRIARERKNGAETAELTLLEQLGAVVVLAQLMVLELCVSRTVVDAFRGAMTVEGGVALALAVVLGASLLRKSIRLRKRHHRDTVARS
jgi:hypothetical protein